MKKEIVVDINPFQTRVVLLEDDKPVEIYIERRGHERLVGNIYYGRVQNVLPGMQAAFVDIGLERNAFLYAGDIIPSDPEAAGDDPRQVPLIQDVVTAGQELLVQVLKEPTGSKGARITTHITLPGRTLVLMPTVNYVGVSRRISDDEERTRLRELLEVVKPQEMGVIVRTAAEGKTKEEFQNDIDFLARLWQRIQKKQQLVSAPRLLHAEEALIFRTIRDLFTADIEKLVINDEDFYESVQVVAEIISPKLKDRVVFYQGEQELYDLYDLNARIDKALARKVWLKNGGYIVIDQTEALTSIDVNTGRFVGTDNLQETITEANCEAAKEIARQVRLRDISGIIVADFIDMEEIADKERVLNTLREEMKKDRTKTNVLGITQLGLVEITRKKVRYSIGATLQMPCPYCKGDGRVLSPETMVLRIRAELCRLLREQSMPNYIVELNPAILDVFKSHANEPQPLLPVAPDRSIYLRALPELHMEEWHVQSVSRPPEDMAGLWKFQ